MLAVHSSPLAALGSREAGGMNVYVRELARELGRRGVAVDIFTRAQRRAEPMIVELGPHARVVTVRTGPAAPYDKNWVLHYLPEFVGRVRCFADGHDLHYDVLHSHYWLSGAAALELRKRWHVPVVQMFHTLGTMKNAVARAGAWRESDARIEIEAQLLREADAIVAATPLDCMQMLAYPGARAERITIIPPGVDIERFKPRPMDAARELLGLPPRHEAPIVLFAGRIEPLKGLDTLLRAFALLADPSALLVVVGGDAHAREDQWSGEERRLRALAGELGLGSRVRWFGSRPQGSLPALFAAADVVAVPSHYESFGLVALEAQACGTPVVASDVGGLRYIVEDGATGFLVPWDDPHAFARRIGALLHDNALRASLGARAVVRARSFAWPRVADRIQELYRGVLRVPPTCSLPALEVARCALP